MAGGGADADATSALIEGRYRLGAVIGRGAMGEVCSAWDERLGRDVAIKRLRADLADDTGVRARFEDEARSAARLSHHAIVTVFDSGEHDGVPYLVMERLPGRTLVDEMAGGPLPEARVESIAVDIAGALEAAHALGVIHRDVKPGNILLTGSGGVKLADFGIAKPADAMDHTQIGTIVGSPSYLAPERLAGAPASARSDLYALGVVLYEALTGTRPFQEDTPVALAHAIHTTAPEPVGRRRPGTEGALASVIDRCMAKDPDERPVSAAEVVGSLRGSDPLATQMDLETRRSDATATTPIATADPGTLAATDVLGPATAVLASHEPLVPEATLEANEPMGERTGLSAWAARSPAERMVLAGLVAVLVLVAVLAAWPHHGLSDGVPTTTAPPTSADLATTTTAIVTTTVPATVAPVAPAPPAAKPGKGAKGHGKK
jgi:serine/threonine-protein kinase